MQPCTDVLCSLAMLDIFETDLVCFSPEMFDFVFVDMRILFFVSKYVIDSIVQFY